MWEGLKEGITGPEIALDKCFIHSASAIEYLLWA